MIETLIVISVLNFGLGIYNYVKHKELEVIVLYGNYPSDFPDDPRLDDADLSVLPKAIKPRPGGKVKIQPVSMSDEDLFELEKIKK
jgi:hypothetical protein